MLRSVILSASNSCFVACPGCYNYFGDTVADTADVLTFVAALCDRVGLEKITVGGGDPLTRVDLVALLAGLRDLGLRIHLDTVGTALLRDAPVRFMGRGIARQVDPVAVGGLVDLVGIPLDGSTDDISGQFRRFSSVAEQEQILAALDTAGATVCVNTVAHRGNIADLHRIATVISQYPCVREWQLFQFMPIGPLGHRNRARFQIPEATFSDAVRQVSRIVAPTVRLVAKEASSRKNRYLLIDSAGVVWMPRQDGGDAWDETDANGDRVTVGSIFAPAIVDRIADLTPAPNRGSTPVPVPGSTDATLPRTSRG